MAGTQHHRGALLEGDDSYSPVQSMELRSRSRDEQCHDVVGPASVDGTYITRGGNCHSNTLKLIEQKAAKGSKSAKALGPSVPTWTCTLVLGLAI